MKSAIIMIIIEIITIIIMTIIGSSVKIETMTNIEAIKFLHKILKR